MNSIAEIIRDLRGSLIRTFQTLTFFHLEGELDRANAALHRANVGVAVQPMIITASTRLVLAAEAEQRVVANTVR